MKTTELKDLKNELLELGELSNHLFMLAVTADRLCKNAIDDPLFCTIIEIASRLHQRYGFIAEDLDVKKKEKLAALSHMYFSIKFLPSSVATTGTTFSISFID